MELTSSNVNLGTRTVVLRVPADPDQILRDSIDAQHRGEHTTDPYWGLLWNAATPMAKLVLRREWPAGATTVELGCGIGLVGIAGLMAGLDLTFTDLVADAVELAVQNATDNGFPNARGHVLDWRTPDHGPVDVLLASDVLYDASLHEPLLLAAGRLLKPRGTLWIGDPGRELARSFIQTAGDEWSVRLFNEHADAIAQPQRGRFQLLELSRRTVRTTEAGRRTAPGP